MNLSLVKNSLRPLAAATLLFAFSLPGHADNPKYNSGPTCVDGGITATCTGRLTGLGNGDVLVDVSFPNATATTLCHSPGRNGSTAPGQNPASSVAITGSKSFPDPKNGSLRFSVTTDAPTAPSAAAAGCPNPNWTVSIEDVVFGQGTVTVSQRDANGTYVQILSNSVNLP